MLIDCGQAYTVTANNFSVAVNGGVGYDIFQLAAAALIPVFITRVLMTANATAAAIQQIQAVRRSSASTGGAAVTPSPQGAGPAASSTCATGLVTTVGTLVNASDSQQWNEFAPYQFDLTPRGILVPAAGWWGLFLPTPPSVAFNASLTVEFCEIK